jgi:RNA-binding protein
MLSSKQRQALKALAHNLKPVVFIGKNGLEDVVTRATNRELLAHELIKVKLQESVTDPKDEVAKTLADQTESELVTVIGRTIILYRPRPDEPVIVLP